MISAEQVNAFNSGTLGLGVDAFSFAIRGITMAVILLWAAWVIFELGQSWAHGGMDFYQGLTRVVRVVLVVIGYTFFLA